MSAPDVLIAVYPEDHPRAWQSIIAELAPDEAGTLRSTYGRQTVEELSAEERGPIRVMTWAEWKAGASAAQAAIPVKWEAITEARYWELLEVLPPINWSGGAFMVSEACDHDWATGRERYQAVRECGSAPYYRTWDASSRPVTHAELAANRATPRGVRW